MSLGKAFSFVCDEGNKANIDFAGKMIFDNKKVGNKMKKEQNMEKLY